MGWRGFPCLPPVTLLLCTACATRVANPNPTKFLIVSAPRDSRVSYTRIRQGESPAEASGRTMTDLITTGLVHPQGLAVDQKNHRLLVTDPDQQTIWLYNLRVVDGELQVGPQEHLVHNTESRWVTVDPSGNIFFSDEPRNQILKVWHEKNLRGRAKNETVEVIMDGLSMAQVNAPGGIATDSFHTYWVNKQIGKQIGSVVQGPMHQNSEGFRARVLPLAQNVDKSYGVCLALNNVYYTQPDSTICAVKKGGSNVVTISDRLSNPRGCVWDGDGTVYVADRGANAVFSFASNMEDLSAAQFSKTVDYQDAFGVAIYSGAYRLQGSWLAGLLLTAIVWGGRK